MSKRTNVVTTPAPKAKSAVTKLFWQWQLQSTKAMTESLTSDSTRISLWTASLRCHEGRQYHKVLAAKTAARPQRASTLAIKIQVSTCDLAAQDILEDSIEKGAEDILRNTQVMKHAIHGFAIEFACSDPSHAVTLQV